MPKQPDLKKIGAFMLAGCAVLLMILGGLLQNKIFNSRGKEIVMYFEESINGLGIGSPVVFKGVKIGEVSRINIETDPESLSFKIPVFAKMHTKSLDSTDQYNSTREVLKALVQKGLRARLISQSYVTGQLMVELEMLPNTPIKYHNNAPALEIPTVLSPIGEISRGLQEIPLAEGVKNFTEFFKNLNHSMPEINKILADIEYIIRRNKGLTAEVLDNFNTATLSVTKAARSMQNLTDYLERHPESLIKGKK